MKSTKQNSHVLRAEYSGGRHGGGRPAIWVVIFALAFLVGIGPAMAEQNPSQNGQLADNRCIPANRVDDSDDTISGCLSNTSYDEIRLLRDRVNEAPAAYYLNFQEARPGGNDIKTEVESSARENFVRIPLDWGVSLGGASVNVYDNTFQAEAVLNDALAVVPGRKNLASVQSIHGNSKVTAHAFRNEALVILNSDPTYKGVLSSVTPVPGGGALNPTDPDRVVLLPPPSTDPLAPPLPGLVFVYDRSSIDFDGIQAASGANVAVGGTVVDSIAVGNRITVGGDSAYTAEDSGVILYTYQISTNDDNETPNIQAVTGTFPASPISPIVAGSEDSVPHANVLAIQLKGSYTNGKFELTDNVLRSTSVVNYASNGYAARTRLSDLPGPGWEVRQHNAGGLSRADTRGNQVTITNINPSSLHANPIGAPRFALKLENSRVTMARNRFEAIATGNLMQSGPSR